MLQNSFRTYSSALCQIRALEKAFNNLVKTWLKRTQNLGFECMHLIGQNKHSKFTCNTLRILPVTMTCTVLCWQTYLGTYSSAFCHIWALKKALRRVTSAKGSQNSEYYMLAFDWLEQTDKIGCNIFPARMTCAELWCQIVWEHFRQLCVKFQPWSIDGGNWICLWVICTMFT